MTDKLRTKLIKAAKETISSINDPSHDIAHTLRVLANAERIANSENVDMDIVIASALFHDIIVYPKHGENSKSSNIHSAELAEKILAKVPEFPPEKIRAVKDVILATSFRFATGSKSAEARVVHDADLLEATGLIGAMRTFGSCGSMNRPFYNPDDPFAENREPNETLWGLDHFYQRLLIAKDKISSVSGKAVAERRTKVLREFLDELKIELEGK